MWLGLVGIAAAAAVGGVGELIQRVCSVRSVDVSDWMAHIYGSVAAVAPYVLCMGAKWYELPEVSRDAGRRAAAYREF
jgi:hypothetical protein